MANVKIIRRATEVRAERFVRETANFTVDAEDGVRAQEIAEERAGFGLMEDASIEWTREEVHESRVSRPLTQAVGCWGHAIAPVPPMPTPLPGFVETRTAPPVQVKAARLRDQVVDVVRVVRNAHPQARPSYLEVIAMLEAAVKEFDL